MNNLIKNTTSYLMLLLNLRKRKETLDLKKLNKDLLYPDASGRHQ